MTVYKMATNYYSKSKPLKDGSKQFYNSLMNYMRGKTAYEGGQKS